MKTLRVIGLVGRLRSGKSTTAGILVREHGFMILKMAGPLKAMLQSIGLTERQIEGDLKEEPCEILCGNTPRYAMQTLGTEWGRDLIGADFWVKAFERRLRNARSVYADDAAGIVVDDCRFPNEFSSLRACGAELWRVSRPGVELSGHASEANVDAADVDLELDNSGDLEALKQAVSKALGR